MKADLLIICALSALLLFGCGESEKPAQLVGPWHFELGVGKEKIPFQAEMIEEDGQLRFYAINGEERIRAEELELDGDSVSIRLPIFNTALIGRLQDGKIIGQFFDYSRKGDYRIPFEATRGQKPRFPFNSGPKTEIAGSWKVEFSPGSDNEYLAIGIFRQQGDSAFGTFLTTTGDYRYLEGNVSGDSLFLSCFDGSHVFLFKAKVSGNKINAFSGQEIIGEKTGTGLGMKNLNCPTQQV